MYPVLLLPLLSADALHNPLGVVLTAVIIALGLIIILLAYVLNGAAEVYREKDKAQTQASAKASHVTPVLILLLMAALPSRAADTQEAAVPVVHTFSGLSPFIYYTLIGVIAFEVTVILTLLFLLQNLLRVEKVAIAPATVRAPKWQLLWSRMNRFKPIQEEASIDTGHDYDGIRELDNRLPGWWIWGFYCCIMFGMVYLWRYHISHTAPLSIAEYKEAVAAAEEAKAEYLAKAANLVDENSVKLLTSADDMAAGKKIFTSTCFACHGADGGGGVGPNLTDSYWLHGGDIQSVFKTIKYGWPDKGMKSWKDDYSPQQIAQLASYVRSLHGTKPAAPKEPQGVLTND